MIVAHADLPLAADLAWLADTDGVTLVPDRHRDGTNVLCVPAGAGFTPAYGAGSFRAHRAEAARLGLVTRLRARRRARLGRRRARRPRGARRRSDPPAYLARRRRCRWIDDLNLPTPAVALAIGAHPDDVEFGCGATLAKWSAAGAVVHHLICTDGVEGQLGPHRPTPPRSSSPARPSSAPPPRALGATGECVFLDWVDGELDSGVRQRWEVAYWIRKLQPTVVLGHDPWKRYRLHPDHRHAGLLAVEGIVAARDPHFFPEQALPHHRPDALLLFEADEPDHVEDVTGFADAKLAALHAHTSQLLSTMGIDERRDRARWSASARPSTSGRSPSWPSTAGSKASPRARPSS